MNRRQFHGCLPGCLAAFALGNTMAQAEESPDPTSDPPVNVRAPTLGGKQFWADELFFHDWHIQRNTFTNHYRLLDGKGFRHAWGTFEQCRTKLDAIRNERKLPAMSGRAVIVLHGLFRSDNSMKGMAKYLRDEGRFATFNVSYPSTQGEVADHAKTLARILENLHGIDEIHFVGHSLGNLVVRHYLADCTDKANGKCPDSRIKRMVMLAPPNNGAQLAEVLLTNSVGGTIAGKSGQQIARDWEKLNQRLAIPEFEFGIIAGGRNQDRGYNPWLKGDNDAIVSVETARLPGAADFVVVPTIHTIIMDNADVQQYTLRFLEHGYFVSPEVKQPIARGAT
jgi:pimeloyl-ACP methyl ester carboxylesterase